MQNKRAGFYEGVAVLPLKAQLFMARKGSVKERLSLTASAHVSLEAKLLLAMDSELVVRLGLASCSFLEPDVQFVLCKDISLQVLSTLAMRSDLVLKTQLCLLNSGYPAVRKSLLANTSLLPEVQEAFLSDFPNDNLQVVFASNECLTESSIIRLLKEGSKEASIELSTKKLSKDAQLLLTSSANFSARLLLAYNECLVEEAQLILSKDKNEIVLCALASNENVSFIVQLLLAKESETVQRSLYANIAFSPGNDFPASFLFKFCSSFVFFQTDRLLPSEREVVLSLLSSWQDSFKELLTAVSKLAL